MGGNLAIFTTGIQASKLFAVIGWHDGAAAVTFKVTPLAFEVLPETQGIRPAPYLASRGMTWLQDTRDPGLSAADLRNHITYSYDMVVAALTAKKRADLGL